MLNKERALLYRYIGWFFLANAVLFWVLGLGYLKAILSSPTLYGNPLAEPLNILEQWIVLCFCYVNYLVYMMFLAFIPAIIPCLLAWFFPRRRLIISVSVVLAFIAAVLLLTDVKIYAMFKFHLNTTLMDMLFTQGILEHLDLSRAELWQIGLMLAGLLLLEIVLAALVWNVIVLPHRFLVGQKLAFLWLAGAVYVVLAVLHTLERANNLFVAQAPSLPLYTAVMALVVPGDHASEIMKRYSENAYSLQIFSNDPLNYPRHPMQNCRAPDKPYNLILIAVDSLRFDSLTPEQMPNVWRFAEQSWYFREHSSGGNGTQPGLFSLFYSIPGNYWTAALQQKKPPVLMSLLQEYGYRMSILFSSSMRYPEFYKTVYLGIRDMALNGAARKDVGANDRYITTEAIRFLEASKGHQPFFLNLFYDAPHAFCLQQNFDLAYPYTPRDDCSRLLFNENVDPVPLYRRYLNAVHFTDSNIGDLLQVIKDQGYLDNSIVIITSDHAQEFNDNKTNYWGHSGNFTRYQTRVPLIVHWPGQAARQIDYQTSGYDLVPTLLQNLFACSNPVDDYSIGTNLLQEAGRAPFLLIGGYVNMGVVEPDRINIIRTSGPVEITDPQGRAIPGAKPRLDVLKQALMQMRHYFKP